MITIFDSVGTSYVIRPCPLINFTWNSAYTEGGKRIGGSYEITLNGKLLAHAGSPIFNFNNRHNADNGTTISAQYYPSGPYTKPAQTQYPVNREDAQKVNLHSILAKQIELRELFSKHCQKIEVASVLDGETEGVIKFYPKLISINFAEGIWVDTCDYTVTLEAKILLDRSDKIIGLANYTDKEVAEGNPTGMTITQFYNQFGGIIEDFQESWSIEPEDGVGSTFNPDDPVENITRIYRLTRNISAKGSDLSNLGCDDPNISIKQPFQQARDYIVKYLASGTLLNNGSSPNSHDDYLSTNYPMGSWNRAIHSFGSGVLNLHALGFGGYNHSRTENADLSAGSYSIQDTWILSSGNAHENYSLSLNSSYDDPKGKVTIEGTIKGLTSIPASGSIFGGNSSSTFNTAYENAINKYREISNQGMFGDLAWTYKRAQRAAGGITLNSTPLSVALATNEFTGEINYTIEYDDRPTNLFGSGVLSEAVSVTDTYPGDVFATIPVLGRKTGPVLQYMGTRTEYQRSVNIELVVLITERNGLQKKPSLTEPTRSSLRNLINRYSPALEPGIRKYFVSPPQESWDPKEGRYSINISWTYELNY